MSDDNVTPIRTEENIPAEALQEALEFERAQHEIVTEERDLLIDSMRRTNKFILDSVIAMGVEITKAREGLMSGGEAFSKFFSDYLDHMPTPSRMDLEDHLRDDHLLAGDRENAVSALSDALTNLGIDPDAIIEAHQEEEQRFIQTLLGGFLDPEDDSGSGAQDESDS